MSKDFVKWEQRVSCALTPIIERCTELMTPLQPCTVIDIGANTGAFISELKKSIEIEQAYLFEPVQEYCDCAKVQFIEDANILCINKALSDFNGQTEIYKSKTDNYGWNTMLKCWSKNMDVENVSCITLDTFAYSYNLSKTRLIKIDTEGYEYKILAGMLSFLASLKEKPYIVCEIAGGRKHPHYDELENVLNKVYDLGYKPVKIKGHNTYDEWLMPK